MAIAESNCQDDRTSRAVRRDEAVTAIYGFSGGGYNARTIWGHLGAVERERIQMIIVLGAPGVEESDFAGNPTCSSSPIRQRVTWPRHSIEHRSGRSAP